MIVISEDFGIIVYRSLLFRSRTEIFCFIMDNRGCDGDGKKKKQCGAYLVGRGRE